MRFARLSLICAAMLAFPATADAQPDFVVAAKAPTGLGAFLLRPGEQIQKVDGVAEFSRTPSFAWKPVAGATRYEFELATSKRFNGSAIIWTNVKDEVEVPTTTTTPTAGTTPAPAAPAAPATTPTAASVYDTLRTPAVALDIALPWITGTPAALYAHVRAITKDGPTRWSQPFGFNVRWSSIPLDLDSPYPGLVRWSPVEGATSYEVWLTGGRYTFHTTTNVADARELYTFHRVSPWTSSISFRVRAQRTVYGEVASGLPTTTYGPWSPVYTDAQPPLSLGSLVGLATASDIVSTKGTGAAHGLTPGFAFGGEQGGAWDAFGSGAAAELYRVYVATDKDCVNIVFRSAIVGSPAYAPRLSGPLELPINTKAIEDARTRILKFGTEGKTAMLDGSPSLATEYSASGTAVGGSTGSSGSGSTGVPAAQAPKIDLPDTAWPSGGYYWTVVPVHAIPQIPDVPLPALPGGAAPVYPVEYRETELPQDACQGGRVMRFGKTSPPVLTSGSARPFASGLSPTGRLVSAVRSKPSFYGTPLVAWQPALGAQDYEVQWSKTGNPFKPVGNLKTPATSALLPLTPGTWYYRVRGFNTLLPKRPQMAWSDPTALTITAPTFRVVKR
ncbi:MAG TPA: hypothetical protein VNI55_08545 [Gaiellaceae bacterium]|nr:hypothetical protein [Gaiellaceae bacterium]